MKNLGCKVMIKFTVGAQQEGIGKTATYRNVTEIHYNYPSPLRETRIAFESDIHGTGYTWDICDIYSFETELETERAETM